MQETWVPFLVWEDPAYLRETKPVCHSYWACALEPTSSAYWSLCPLEPVLCSKRSHCSEKPVHWNKDPAQPKINTCNFFSNMNFVRDKEARITHVHKWQPYPFQGSSWSSCCSSSRADPTILWATASPLTHQSPSWWIKPSSFNLPPV